MRWILTEGVRWMDVDDQIVIHVPGARGFVDLDSFGAELWTVLTSGGLDDLCVTRHLSRTHDVDPVEADSITKTFIAELGGFGVLVPADSGGPHERDARR